MDPSVVLLVTLISCAWGYAPLHEPPVGGPYSDAAVLQELMERINRDMDPMDSTYNIDLGSNKLGHSATGFSFVPGRTIKDSEFFDENDYDTLLGPSGHPSIRDEEYLRHSTLFGHKMGEPATSMNVKGQKIPTEVKPDTVLPAYCNPPNPCPVGYSAEDGCLEIFENTAAFSRAYQASQDCMCDTEHMFDCHASSQESDDEEGPDNNGMGRSSNSFLAGFQLDGQHKRVVAKKFYNKKAPEETLRRIGQLAKSAAATAHSHGGINLDENPYLQGEKLPIAAKKGLHAL